MVVISIRMMLLCDPDTTVCSNMDMAVTAVVSVNTFHLNAMWCLSDFRNVASFACLETRALRSISDMTTTQTLADITTLIHSRTFWSAVVSTGKTVIVLTEWRLIPAMWSCKWEGMFDWFSASSLSNKVRVECEPLAVMCTMSSWWWSLNVISPFPSSGHHLSYDDCLEDKRENIIRTVLCCVVYDSCTQWYAHTHMSSS